MGKNLFISYSRADIDYVRRLVDVLRDKGFNIWFDANIRSGQHWDQTIQQEITKSDILIIILSINSVASNNVMDEASYAMSKDKTIIPVRIDNCEAPMRLARFQHIDLSTDFKAGVERLVSDINYDSGNTNTAFAKAKPVTAYTKDTKPDNKLKKILLIAIPVILIVGGIFWYSGKGNGPVEKIKAEEATMVTVDSTIAETPVKEEPAKPTEDTDAETDPPDDKEPVNPGGFTKPTLQNPAFTNAHMATVSSEALVTVTNSKSIIINGQIWSANDINLNNKLSICYNNDCKNGRLYTLRGAALACESLGDGWRLPTDADWQKLVRGHGADFNELTVGGNSQFNATLSGKRIYNTDNFYFYDLGSVGYYWTGTADKKSKGNAVVYVFRIRDGQKAVLRDTSPINDYMSCRCIKD